MPQKTLFIKRDSPIKRAIAAWIMQNADRKFGVLELADGVRENINVNNATIVGQLQNLVRDQIIKIHEGDKRRNRTKNDKPSQRVSLQDSVTVNPGGAEKLREIIETWDARKAGLILGPRSVRQR